MATVLDFPKYSFVQRSEILASGMMDCIPSKRVCFPLSYFNFLAFQMRYSSLSDPPSEGETRHIYAIPVKGDCYTGSLLPTPTIPRVIEAEVFETEAASPYLGVVNFNINNVTTFAEWNAFTTVDPIEIGDCFRFWIIEEWERAGDISVRNVIACTNCFYRVAADDQCFFSVLTYHCNENSYEFIYDEEFDTVFSNTIMLPFYLKEPQLITEESSYRKSDGGHIKLMARTDEDWKLETDWMPYHWQKCLEVALNHDSVNILNKNYSQMTPVDNDAYFVKSEKLDIQWTDTEFGLAKSQTTLRRQYPIHLLNSNCK